ncbi:winged helix-turn-helix domain-containing protein [Candidatus Micrarchaeota archaeon]|nr:winged helix-turn-helix domain-containing protein [Candidatus Micrarchaeota archaeon]
MPTVEEYFGKNAGVVWHALKEKGPMNIAQLKSKTKLTDKELYGALGWLGREGKTCILGNTPLLFKFSLKE